MLRRKPTAITLTSEDVAAYEDARRAASNIENYNPNTSFTNDGRASGAVDPNDELKPLPGDKARIVRATRDERITGR